jgi:hypothetical protein
MTAFSAAMDRIFNNPNMAADATWVPAAGGDSQFCRVIRRMADDGVSFGLSAARVPAMLADVRVSEIARPVKGDVIEIGDERFRVSAAPSRDLDRLIWTLELEPTA